MLRLSKMADYGTVVMTTIAREPDRVHSAAELASRTGLGVPTVSKILKTLAGKGLVESLRGAKGGYLLPRSPARISIAQVITAMDGPIGMTECSTMPGLCSQESDCTIRSNWLRINRVIRRALEEVTLAQMAKPIPQAIVFGAMARGQPITPA
ncbi:MAG: SUF system Fe-S cluster assembly regulator [Betaproteobacteria bacterium]|nr:SUF system Fe-S cluster assembly regulator [Betaproteobacteria bacterium]